MTQLTVPVTTSSTRLHGPLLMLARVVWVALVAFYFGAYLVTIPIKLSELPQSGDVRERDHGARISRGCSTDGHFTWRLYWLVAMARCLDAAHLHVLGDFYSIAVNPTIGWHCSRHSF